MSSFACYFCNKFGFSTQLYADHIQNEHPEQHLEWIKRNYEFENSDERTIEEIESAEELGKVPFPDRGQLRPESEVNECGECMEGKVVNNGDEWECSHCGQTWLHI